MKRVLRFLGLAALCCVGLNALAEDRTASTLDELKAAIAAAEDDDTVKLTADIDLGSKSSGFPLVTITKAITVDFNGKTISGATGTYSASAEYGLINVDAPGKVVLFTDTGTGNGGVDTEFDRLLWVKKDTGFRVEGGVFQANCGSVVYAEKNATVVLSGGKFVAKEGGKNYSAVIKIAGASIEINDGTQIIQNGKGSYAWGVELSTAYISEINAYNTSVLVMNGGVIDAGKVDGYGYAIECGSLSSCGSRSTRKIPEVTIKGGHRHV